jgi:hypothetical protein
MCFLVAFALCQHTRCKGLGLTVHRLQVLGSSVQSLHATMHHGMALRAGVLLPEKCQVVQAVALVVTTKPSSLG